MIDCDAEVDKDLLDVIDWLGERVCVDVLEFVIDVDWLGVPVALRVWDVVGVVEVLGVKLCDCVEVVERLTLKD